jgi:hypothetical protein
MRRRTVFAGGVGHVHSRDAALAVMVGALAGVALLATACVAAVQRGGPARAGVGQAGQWSIAAFLVAESAGFAFSETHVVPPPLTLLAGVAVHVLCGAAAAVLCSRSVEGTLVAAAAAAGAPVGVPEPSVDRFGSPSRCRPKWLLLRPSGRAPPRRWAFA